MSAATEARRATLLVVGLSHETAPVEVRERASLGEPATRRLLRALGRTPAVGEALALCTCNRTEVYALVAPGEVAQAPNRIREMLSRETSIYREELVQLGYDRTDRDAAEHLLGVVAGLNSTMLGEPEVVGQVRAAGAVAREEGTPARCSRACCATRSRPAAGSGLTPRSPGESPRCPRWRSTWRAG